MLSKFPLNILIPKEPAAKCEVIFAQPLSNGEVPPYLNHAVLSVFKSKKYVKQDILPLLRISDDPNQILKRAALLHADIAMLQLDTGEDDRDRPEAIAARSRYTDHNIETSAAHILAPYDRRSNSKVGSTAASFHDGRGIMQSKGWHWEFARQLLDKVSPHPSQDDAVKRWYIATSAYMRLGGISAMQRTTCYLRWNSSRPIPGFYFIMACFTKILPRHDFKTPSARTG